MEQVSALVDADPVTMEAAHDDPTSLGDEPLRTLLEALVKDVDDEVIVYLDDVEVHTKDQAHDSEHNHVNKKEIVSGDAVVWVAETEAGGEVIRRYDVQYGVYAGMQDGTFIYDTVEVELLPK